MTDAARASRSLPRAPNAAARVAARPAGTLVLTPSLPLFGDASFLRVDRSRCVAEARASGASHVFLLADDDDDWPKELYASLGFDVVGVEHAFVRPHDA